MITRVNQHRCHKPFGWHNVYHKGFKSTFMNNTFFWGVVLVLLLVFSPVCALTNKIPAGAPVFIGESDIDITPAIKDCHVIGWWPDEQNITGKAARNLTLKQLNEANGKVAHFNVSPEIFTGYTGNWYCEDKVPTFLILRVNEPTLSLRVWDTDNDMDVTGQSVPLTTNVTYRIDTNLNQVLSYSNRTDLNPSDSFFTVKMANPSGKVLTTIYTGSVGGADTQILFFDTNPFITTPTYLGKNLGSSWNRLSRDASGGFMYPPGVYTFTVSQNLNHMQELYRSSGITDLTGIATGSASVRFLPLESLSPTPVTTPQTSITSVPTTIPPTEVVPVTTIPTQATPEPKTTYAPLPWSIIIVGLGIAGILFARKP